MEEIFLGLKKGDSIAFESPAVKIFGELNMPPFIKGDGKIKIQIGVVDVLDEDGIQAYFLALQDAQEKKQKDLSVKQLEEDVKIIEEYVAENNLNAIKTESGLFYVIEEEGSGEQITSGQSASVHYAGYLLDGTLFDTSVKEKAQAAGLYNAERDKNGGYASFDLNVGVGLVIPGWDEGLLLLKKGSKAKFIIPSTLAYGERGSGAVIKPNSVLVFDIDVIEVN